MTQDGFDGANVLLAATVNRTAQFVSSNSTDDEITVEGDVTGDLATTSNLDEQQEDTNTDTFTLSGASDDSLNQDYSVSSSPTYDSTNDETTIPVSEDITVDISDGEGEIDYDVFTDVGVQTNLKQDSKAKIITANHKKKGFKNKIYGKDDGSLTLNALELPPSREEEALNALEKAKEDEDEITLRRRKVDPDTDNNVIEEAPFLVSNISKKNPDNDASNYSADLEQNDSFSTISS